MARTDDFRTACRLAVDALAGQDARAVARRAGYTWTDTGELAVPFLDRDYRVQPPRYAFRDAAVPERAVPLQEQVLILHYLLAGERPAAATNRWLAFREIPGAALYHGVFAKRAIDPLKRAFGRRMAALAPAARRIGARSLEAGDAACEVRPLPRVPLQLIVWEGDDEFAPEAGILFDAAAGDLLSPEDAVWLASLTVYRLLALAS